MTRSPTRRGPAGLLPAALLMLAAPLFAACSPMCTAVDAWTWGTCHADVHGGAAVNVASVIAAPVPQEYAEAIDRARALVRALVVEDNLPGLSLAAGLDGEIVWAEGFGWADIAARRPVTPATLFRAGAVAEPMTAVAVGLLLERGRLDIDRPVQDYVPAFPVKPWPVTTRQLMGHIAGMRPLGVEEMLYLGDSCTGPLDAVAGYADDSLLFEPGTAFRRSADGFKLVGAVVEAAAGEPFPEFMQRELFDPLGMDATVRDHPARPVDGTVFFYWPFANLDTRTGIEHANNPDNSCQLGAAGWLTTPSDLVRFGMAVLEGRLLERGTHEMLQTPLVLAAGEQTGHGLGWSLRQIPLGPDAAPAPAFGQDGRSAGGTTSLLIVPGHDIVVAVTSNVSYARNLPDLAARLAGRLEAGAR